MAKRKADSDSPSKRQPKKQVASQKQSIKPETPAAKAYRRKRAAKLAHAPSDTSKPSPEAFDLYDFPPTLPSPPPSDGQTPPAAPKIDLTVVEDKAATRNDEQNAEHTSTIEGKVPDDDTLLAILCVFIDVALTELALDAVMQKAAAAAKSGDELGTLYMRKFISKLVDTHIEDEWLARVIDLL